MPFATDGVSPVGGVPEVGVGATGYNVQGSGALGTEPARYTIKAHAFLPFGNFRPQTQVPVLEYPQQKTNETAPGLGTMFGKFFQRLLGNIQGIEPTRGLNIPTAYERVAVLSGMPNDHPDAERRGLTFERLQQNGKLDFGQPGNKDLVAASTVGVEPIENEPADGLTDDQTQLVQDYPSNPHQTLRNWRQTWPSSPVKQSPTQTKSVVLAQRGVGGGNFRGEIPIPSAAVTARISWTNKWNTDLWVSFSSAAMVPQGANQVLNGSGDPQAIAANDGPLLNPQTDTDYYVKNKRVISLEASGATTVNVAFFEQ